MIHSKSEDSAYFVLSKSRVLDAYTDLKDKSDFVSYSMKTNREVGQVLEEETDCLFSLHTIQSVEVLKDKSRIWFFSQGWSREDLDLLFEEGIRKYVVDNEKDLDLLIEYIKDKDEDIELLIRMRLKENTIHKGKHYVFGMYSQTVNERIVSLKDNKNITKIGIHFHRKTQNISEWSLKYEFESVISDEILDIIDYVNIGGGLPAKYKNYRAEILERIFSKIKEFKDFLHEKGIKMIVEPGRYIAAPSVKLKCKIKNIYNNNIIVNCSVFNSDTDAFISHLRLLVEGELEEGKGEPYTIKGCTPDSIDIFRYKVWLNNPEIGDTIIFLNAGAYNFATDFCNLPKLETKIEK